MRDQGDVIGRSDTAPVRRPRGRHVTTIGCAVAVLPADLAAAAAPGVMINCPPPNPEITQGPVAAPALTLPAQTDVSDC
jgi:hypothetical protein